MEGTGHNDLCFGCGAGNAIGLQLEAHDAPDGAVTGRFYVKHDHQGPRGRTHPGVLATALLEGLALAGGEPLAAELRIAGRPAIGASVHVTASAEHAVAVDEASGQEIAWAACPRAHA